MKDGLDLSTIHPEPDDVIVLTVEDAFACDPSTAYHYQCLMERTFPNNKVVVIPPGITLRLMEMQRIHDYIEEKKDEAIRSAQNES